MSRERIVVAMSGGVDSAVAAARCVRAGFDVVGVSLRLAPGGEGSCCSLDDFLDARRVAEHLGFPHYVFDFTDVFAETVIAPFVQDYLSGRTPNPCARCNQHVKFGPLWDRARELGATTVATGHYARITFDAAGVPALRAARDAAKDQSYFLFGLNADMLRHTRFPIGDGTKADVRAEARALGLPVADKPESMDVCFVPRGATADFVMRNAAPEHLRPGAIVDEAGRIIGRHDGVHRFTIGQRRGLRLDRPERHRVQAIDAASGTIHVTSGPIETAAGLRASGMTWGADGPPAPGTSVAIRVRHRHPLAPARIVTASPDETTVAFTTWAPLVTPGQAAVLYQDDRVVGGGWIDQAVTT